MDKNSNYLAKGNDDTFAQYCLQTLAPLINFPFIMEDREIIKAQNHPCNCSKSGCLKLYCECFAKGMYCMGCNCINCFNSPKYENLKNNAVVQLINRDSEAFVQQKKLQKGCTCKKSNCQKKYCKCHVNGKHCNESCKCVECKNMSYTQI